ncbi:hypothetical protein F5Y17DRAFT_44506 [Xylariaceae sp. FL0594]|nr:hypothetical protein F5Y17DRAFT_44506 [Xylariaceae sp. FL0594]
MTVRDKVANAESCCTCAALLAEVPRFSESEKPFPEDRWLECCPRAICGRCVYNNPRFQSYCPYCQISQTNSTLPPGLKDPPSYTKSVGSSSAPPPYTPSPVNHKTLEFMDEKSAPPDEVIDTLHFLDHAHDTINSLSLRYGVPAAVLRKANNISSDHLLAGRRTAIIPGTYYKEGVSLSPRPIEGEEEEARKSKIRRWMVTCKVPEYDVAVLYLEQAGYDFQLATETYFADEEWERTNPAGAARRGKRLNPANTSGARGSLWR